MLAGGVESMSRSPYVLAKADRGVRARPEARGHDARLALRQPGDARTRYGIDSMTQTAENVAREDGDRAARTRTPTRCAASSAAERARAAGRLAREIAPVAAAPAASAQRSSTATSSRAPPRRSERPRPAKPLLGPGGTITAGNASGLNDGAARVLLASEQAAARHGLEPIARVTGMASAGVAPRVMGRGPAARDPQLLARQGRSLGDYDVVELNEAFAAQVLAVHARAGARRRRGARQPERRRDRARPPARRERRAAGARPRRSSSGAAAAHRALVSLCVGVGQGLALSLERPA